MKKGKPIKKDGVTVLRGEWSILDTLLLNSLYMNRIIDTENDKPNKSLSSWFQTIKTIYRPVVNLNAPSVYNEYGINYINLSKQFLFKTTKPYSMFSNETKANSQLFLTYMKEVLCSNNDEHYMYLLKWVSNMIKGEKNDSLLYLKGVQGLGKSTFTDMLN